MFVRGDPAVVVVARFSRGASVLSPLASDEVGICEVVVCPCGPAAASLQVARWSGSHPRRHYVQRQTYTDRVGVVHSPRTRSQSSC